MRTHSAPHARAHALSDLQALLDAFRHVGGDATHLARGTGQEIEIDIDREIWCLELLSGVADIVGHGARQTRDYIAWIASICADASDRGASAAEMRRMVETASQHCAPPWRHLADLLARRCAMFAQRYGVEAVDGPSGEIIRWLFADAGQDPSNVLH